MGSDPGPLGHLGPEVGAVQPGQEGRGLGRRGWACRGGGSGTGLPGCGDPCPRLAKLQLGFQEEAGTSWDLWYPGPGAGGVYLRLGGGQPWRGEGTPGACPWDPVQPSLLSRARPAPKRPRSPWRAVQPGSWGPFSLGRCSVAWGPRGHGRGGQRECQRGRPPHPRRMLPAGCGLWAAAGPLAQGLPGACGPSALLGTSGGSRPWQRLPSCPRCRPLFPAPSPLSPAQLQRSQEALVGPSASGLTASGGPRGAPWEGPGVHAWPLPRAGPALHCPPHQPQAHPLPALVCRAFSSLPGEHRFLPDHRCCGPSLHLGSPRTWGSFDLGCQGPRPLTPLRLKASGGLVCVLRCEKPPAWARYRASPGNVA